ncbi:MAG: phosphoribosyltransferase [Dehalococcoidia bacterium]
MARLPFADRREAGALLGKAVRERLVGREAVVLGLPRGGVPVAYEVAAALGAPLDVFVVRKLGVPGQEELALGAIASGGVQVLNEDLVRELGIGPEAIERIAERERHELERREHLYRDGRPPVEVRGRHVVVVDDGLATGATMRAAVAALRAHGPASVTVAVPVAAEDTRDMFRLLADDIICLATPEPFRAVGLWYRDFRPTSDDEVRDLLAKASRAARGD